VLFSPAQLSQIPWAGFRGHFAVGKREGERKGVKKKGRKHTEGIGERHFLLNNFLVTALKRDREEREEES